MNRIDQLFSHMDRWRHLPAYQLERRADIFFSLYLAEVLEVVTGVVVDPRLIPELPMLMRLFDAGRQKNDSARLDYCALAGDRRTAFFVELKTDINSVNQKQDKRMAGLADERLLPVIEGIIHVAQSKGTVERKSDHQKYIHLLNELKNHGCVSLPDGVLDYAFRNNRTGLTELLPGIVPTVGAHEFEIRVVYIQPRPPKPSRKNPKFTYIDFRQFAEVVEKHKDPTSQTFARHLRQWTSDAGGERPRQG